MLLWILSFFFHVYAERQQIGHFPIKGNVWRAKYPEEIGQYPSASFLEFAQKAIFSQSPETGILYYVFENTDTYPHLETDDTICSYSLDRNLPNARKHYAPEIYEHAHIDRGASHVNFTFYFACDDYCCGLECCQKDVPMTLLGFTAISISVFILLIYTAICCGGILCAWRNGALGKKLQFNGKSPEKKRQKSVVEETTMSVLKASSSERNGTMDTMTTEY